MNRIIINVGEGVSEQDALILVGRVVSEGRVSNYGKQYCYHSTFSVGLEKQTVEVNSNLTRNGTDSFDVWAADQEAEG